MRGGLCPPLPLSHRRLPLSCRRFPSHNDLRPPWCVRQFCDEEISQNGNVCWTCSSRRRHKIQSSFGEAPVDKERLKLLLAEILGRDKFRQLSNGEPIKYDRQQCVRARSPERPGRCNYALFTALPIGEPPDVPHRFICISHALVSTQILWVPRTTISSDIGRRRHDKPANRHDETCDER